jgi:hypothetical protein
MKTVDDSAQTLATYVAKCPNVAILLRTRGADRRSSMLPNVSGAQCVRALQRAGFDLELHGPDYVMAKLHGVPIVRVPLVDELTPAQITTILGLTGITPDQLTRLLQE